MSRKEIFVLGAAIVISELAGIVGSLFTVPAIPTWYAGLVKPALNPPAWVFAPVWTVLYILMGVAIFLVWRRGTRRPALRPAVKVAISVFAAQLVLNAAWSFLFFGMRAVNVAFVEIVALWMCILATVIACGRVSRAAAWLLVPYLAWVSFAAYLNYSLMVLN